MKKFVKLEHYFLKNSLENYAGEIYINVNRIKTIEKLGTYYKIDLGQDDVFYARDLKEISTLVHEEIKKTKKVKDGSH